MLEQPSTGTARPLPALREDLQLMRGPVTTGGTPTWTLHDPVRNAFFRIGRREFEILCRWERPTEELLDGVARETTITVSADDIEALYRFLAANQLLRPDDPGVRQRLKQRARAAPESRLRRILLNYLFFRIPLVRPDRFLARTLPWVRRGARAARFLFPPALLLALLVLLRQWSEFIHTFPYFFTLQGILLYALAIVMAKVAHELAHAYAAKHFGLRVPTLGVAFMVLWPILYTDNTEAWRVRHRSTRMTIVASGMMAELVIAVAATLLWAVLPDGPARAACFILASATWISSLIINSMPFLRFDGYYFLSDWLDMPNLHQRASAFGRWYLHRLLLGVNHPAPEAFSPGRQKFLIVFAYATWLYRLFLFTGIALLVYHLFFKVLGLLLFFVEIVWFIGRPVATELRGWPRLVEETGFTRQNLILLMSISTLLVLMLLPLKGGIHVPALLKPGVGNWLYSPAAARIESVHVHNGQSVAAGERLFDLKSPDLEHKIRLTRSRVALLEARIKRQMTHPLLREQGQVFHRQLAQARATLAGFRQQADQLIIRADTAGTIVDMPDGMGSGRWVNPGQRLGLLVDPKEYLLEGLVPESLLSRIQPGARGRFYPHAPDRPILTGTLTAIDTTGTRVLDEPYLASVFGGEVPVMPVGNTLSVRKSLYRVVLTPELDSSLYFQATTGRLHLKARPRSMVARAWHRLAALVIRESGF